MKSTQSLDYSIESSRYKIFVFNLLRLRAMCIKWTKSEDGKKKKRERKIATVECIVATECVFLFFFRISLFGKRNTPFICISLQCSSPLFILYQLFESMCIWVFYLLISFQLNVFCLYVWDSTYVLVCVQSTWYSWRKRFSLSIFRTKIRSKISCIFHPTNRIIERKNTRMPSYGIQPSIL